MLLKLHFDTLLLEYIREIMHPVRTSWRCVVIYNRLILPISFKVTTLALGQSYDCPSASEATLKDMGNLPTYIFLKNISVIKEKKYGQIGVHILWDVR